MLKTRKRDWIDWVFIAMGAISFIATMLTFAFVDSDGIYKGGNGMNWTALIVSVVIGIWMYLIGYLIKRLVQRELSKFADIKNVRVLSGNQKEILDELQNNQLLQKEFNRRLANDLNNLKEYQADDFLDNRKGIMMKYISDTTPEININTKGKFIVNKFKRSNNDSFNEPN